MTAFYHFQVQGVRCNGCVGKIRTALQAQDADAELTFDLERQQAHIRSALDPQTLDQLLDQLGYAPEPLVRQTQLLTTEGVRCNGCLGKIRAAAEALDSEIQFVPDFPGQRLSVTSWLPPAQLCDLINELGYGARPVTPQTWPIAVSGVRCNGCVNKIRSALQAVDKEVAVEADLQRQLLQVTTTLSRQQAERPIAELGYLADAAQEVDAAAVIDQPGEASPDTSPSVESSADPLITLNLSGMTCAACVSSVERALGGVAGVASVLVNFANRTALIEGEASVEALVAAVDAAGYGATPVDDPEQAEQQRQEEQRRELRHRVRSAAFALGLGVPMMVYGTLYGMALESDAARMGWGAVGLLTLAMMWFAGRHFFSGAWKALRNGTSNMDTLIALGTGSAWLYSMVAVLAPALIPAAARGLYFEAAAMIIGLVNVGQALELRARGRTQAAVRSLLDLRPKTARVVRDGVDEDIPLDAVQVGDLLRIRPGEHVPVDAEVVEGHSQVDESMLTGEPLAVAKTSGDLLSAGTLNGNGSLLARAVRVGRDTALARIVELVRKAQNSKPPISRLADRVASIFVPAVVVIALVTAAAWYLLGPEPKLTYMLVTAVTVLIIACPCALGLATPISTMIGVGKAAELGVLIRSGDALQQASTLTTVVVDKTGTVTEGRPAVTRFQLLGGGDETELLGYLHALEQRSEHPLAEALVQFSGEHAAGLAVTGFEAVSGQGVRARVGEAQVTVGNRALMDAEQVPVSAVDEQVGAWQADAETVVYLAVDGTLRALLAVADPIRADAAEAIARLHEDGLRVVMLSGDNHATVEAVARRLGIDRAHAELQPADKLALIGELQQRGERVAMVGDGINDAPALSRADVGFAIGTGTDVAIESADVALMKASLHGVADAIELSRATLTNIRQNLWGAFAYNGLGIPVAAGLLYPFTGLLLNPVVAGLAMSLSSVTVVSNANRLRLFRVSPRDGDKKTAR